MQPFEGRRHVGRRRGTERLPHDVRLGREGDPGPQGASSPAVGLTGGPGVVAGDEDPLGLRQAHRGGQPVQHRFECAGRADERPGHRGPRGQTGVAELFEGAGHRAGRRRVGVPDRPAPQHGRGGGGGPAGQEPRAAQVADVLGGELQRGDGAEVASAAPAQGPEQVAVRVRRVRPHPADAAVGGDDLHLAQVVAGQTPGAGERGQTSAEGDSGQTDGGAPAQRQAGTGRGQRQVGLLALDAGTEPGVPAAHGGGVEGADVDHEPGAGGVSGVAVPAGAQRQRDAARAGEVDALDHVVDVRRVGDRLGTDAVEPLVDQQAGLFVGGLLRPQQHPAQARLQRRPLRRGARGARGALDRHR